MRVLTGGPAGASVEMARIADALQPTKSGTGGTTSDRQTDEMGGTSLLAPYPFA
jgi:hypothetical protein